MRTRVVSEVRDCPVVTCPTCMHEDADHTKSWLDGVYLFTTCANCGADFEVKMSVMTSYRCRPIERQQMEQTLRQVLDSVAPQPQ